MTAFGDLGLSSQPRLSFMGKLMRWHCCAPSAPPGCSSRP